MRFCENHWAELRQAIADRGLAKFTSPDGAEAARRLVAGASGSDARSAFDPLMGAHNAIVANALEWSGLTLMLPNDDGSERCPLCFLIAGCDCKARGETTCAFATWITRAADGALAQAKQLGLVGEG